MVAFHGAMSNFKTKQQKAKPLISYMPEKFSLSLTHTTAIAFTISHMLNLGIWDNTGPDGAGWDLVITVINIY